jgi:hypothetical protein
MVAAYPPAMIRIGLVIITFSRYRLEDKMIESPGFAPVIAA